MSIVNPASNTRRTDRLDRPHRQSNRINAIQTALGNSIEDANAKPISKYFKVKPAFEWCLTLIVICLALPILILLSLCLLVTDGRPIFYRQVRVGRNFKLFYIWKFRTMRRDAEIETGAVWSSHFDARVTKIGKWLRATHLDELPQILNVIAGHMHVIGPRPERPEFVKKLILEIPNYDRRLEVRPGITGLAQVIQGYDSCYRDVAKKVALDVEYIKSASLTMDCQILLLTIPYIARELKTAFETKHRHYAPEALIRADTPNPASISQSIEVASSASNSFELQIQTAIREQLEEFRLKLDTNTKKASPKLTTQRRDSIKQHNSLS